MKWYTKDLYGYRIGQFLGVIRLMHKQDNWGRELAIWERIDQSPIGGFVMNSEEFPVLEKFFIHLIEPNDLLKEIL